MPRTLLPSDSVYRHLDATNIAVNAAGYKNFGI